MKTRYLVGASMGAGMTTTVRTGSLALPRLDTTDLPPERAAEILGMDAKKLRKTLDIFPILRYNSEAVRKTLL